MCKRSSPVCQIFNIVPRKRQQRMFTACNTNDLKSEYWKYVHSYREKIINRKALYRAISKIMIFEIWQGITRSPPPVVWVCKRGCLLFGIISERFVHFLGNLNFNITKSRRASDSLNPTLLNNQIPRSEIFQSKDFQSIKLQRIFSDDHHHFPGEDAGEQVYIFCFCQDYLYVGHSGGMIT